MGECGGGEGEGDGEVVLDVWEWGADVYWEAFCCAGYVPLSIISVSFFGIFEGAEKLIWMLGRLEMKLIIAAIYTNFSTHIVDDAGIEQEDAYTAGPRGNKLMLRFERAEW